MKEKLRRSCKITSRIFYNSATNLALSLRHLCICKSSSHTTILGVDSDHLKYLINSSLILLFGLLHTADGIVTYFGLKFNYATEVNPVLLFFAGTMGLGLAIFALKLLIVEFIALMFVSRRNIGSCWGTATLFSADAFYSWVVSNNLFLVVGA